MKGSHSEGQGTNVAPVVVHRALHGIEYPTTKEDLLERARANHADEKVLDYLERLPDREFREPADVATAHSHPPDVLEE